MFITVGSDKAASSRVRAATVIGALHDKGWNIDRVVAASRLWPLLATFSVAKRKPDLIVLQKVVPPAWFLRLLRVRTDWMVFEIDDAIYFGYPGSPQSVPQIEQRVRSLVRIANRVVTSNNLIAQDLERMGASELHVFPGPAPSVRSVQQSKDEKAVCWLGSPSTYPLVAQTFEALSSAPSTGEFRLCAVGAREEQAVEAGVEFVPWSATNEEAVLQQSSAGLLPVQRGPWEERKAAYKLLEYLANEVRPVCPDSPALRTLLGDETEQLVILVSAPYADVDWQTAVRLALSAPVTDTWLEARDRVFDRWSVANFAALFVSSTARR